MLWPYLLSCLHLFFKSHKQTSWFSTQCHIQRSEPQSGWAPHTSAEPLQNQSQIPLEYCLHTDLSSISNAGITTTSICNNKSWQHLCPWCDTNSMKSTSTLFVNHLPAQLLFFCLKRLNRNETLKKITLFQQQSKGTGIAYKTQFSLCYCAQKLAPFVNTGSIPHLWALLETHFLKESHA